MPTSTYACLVIGAVAPRLERYGIIYRTARLPCSSTTNW
jgi:hypothetical protein